MKKYTFSAPAKFILFGEHAVVFGYPAIAMPVVDIRAYVTLLIDQSIDEPFLDALDLRNRVSIRSKTCPPEMRHFIEAIQLVSAFGGIEIPDRGWALTIRSDIPISRGLGSSAAISVALVKALYRLSEIELSTDRLIQLSYELEKQHHGTPSGIDNTVVSLENPIYYRRGEKIRLIDSHLFYFVIGDTGIGKSTATIVAEVADRYKRDEDEDRRWFQAIGDITDQGLTCLASGDHQHLGQLMNQNQALLRKIGVSATELERLITVAQDYGALGAKLCGAGKGGCMISVTEDEKTAIAVSRALLQNGAVNSFVSRTIAGT